MKDRKDCNCHCHQPGMTVKHMVACCTVNLVNAICGKCVGSRPWWMGADQYDECLCLLAPNHDGDCKCRHTLDNAA